MGEVKCAKYMGTDMDKAHRILILRDRPADAELVARELQTSGRGCEFAAKTVTTESEKQFHAMFDLASIGMAQADPRTGQWVRVNRKMCAITGYSASELLRMRISELTHPDDRQKDGDDFARVVRGAAPDYRLEKRYLRKDGGVAWVNVNMTVIRDAAGQPVRTMAAIEDITERKQAEERVRELNLMLRATGAINSLMVRERDPKRLLAEACKILVETRGYQLAWIGQVEPGSKRVVPQGRAGKDAGYLDAANITWDETPTGQGPIGTAIRTGQPGVCQDTATDPRFAPWKEAAMVRKFASVAALPMIAGSRVLGAVAVYSERTGAFNAEELGLLNELAADLAFALQSTEHEQERKRSEESLRENERRYRLLFNSGYDAVFVHQGGSAGNGLGKFIEVNDIACQRLGYTREELLQMTPLDISAPGTVPGIPGIRAKLAREKAAVFEMVHIAKDGRRIAVEISTQVFKLNGKRTLLSTVRDITERKRAEAHSHLLGEALKSAANAIVITDREGVIIWANAAFTKLTGYPLEEALGRKPSFLKSGAQEQTFYAKLWETVLAGRVWSAEMINRRKDGSLYTEENTITPVRNEQGDVAHFIAVKQDITERKRSELRTAALANLGQRLSAAKSAKEAGAIIMDVADNLFGWDCCLFHLYSAHENRLSNVLCMDLINGRRTECKPPGFPRPPTELARRVIEQGGQLILRDQPDSMPVEAIHFGDTSRPSASIMYVPIRYGTETVGVLSIQSYTPGAYDAYSLKTLQALADHCGGALDRLRIEEGWQNTQQRLRHVLAQSPAVIYSLKTDGKTAEPAWVSDNVERLLGYTAAECNGPDGLFSQLHPQDRQGAVGDLAQLFANKEIARDYRIQHKNGEYRWLRDEQRLVCDAKGAPVEIVGSWVDITERKALEEQLRQSQKMEAVGQLAGGVAHDFNNMLAVIRGNAELLLMDQDQYPPQAKEGLEHVVAASERAANLTRQLLTFSRKNAMQAQPLLLNEVVANLTKMLNRVISENIELQCQYAALLPYVQADTGMMEQVILNLVVNARDAMPKGGQLRVVTEQVTLDEAQARVNPGARAGKFVCLSVSDTGSGIAPEVLPRIFEPFFTTKEIGKGTGLGLATVYGIVKQHQGWLEVSSQVGEGSTFKVFLPAIPTPARLAAAAEAGAEVRGGNETILLVEDDHAVRLTTRRVLESKGYRILEATSGREALEVWQSHAEKIALMLTDIIMPGEMTGRDLAERLWGQRPGSKVIFMSGYSADVLGTNRDFIRRTRSHFLQKPCSARAILETVRRCLDEKESVAAPGEAGRAK